MHAAMLGSSSSNSSGGGLGFPVGEKLRSSSPLEQPQMSSSNNSSGSSSRGRLFGGSSTGLSAYPAASSSLLTSAPNNTSSSSYLGSMPPGVAATAATTVAVQQPLQSLSCAASTYLSRDREVGGVGETEGEDDGAGVAAVAAAAAAAAEDFENMVGDLRRIFISWLKKTESDLRREQRELQRKRKEFEEEKKKAWRSLQEQKETEHEKIKEERRKAQSEVAVQVKQIQIEREDARRKLNSERARFEEEKQIHRRKTLLETERLRQEAELLAAEQRRVVDTNIATETVVDVNVGGVIFEAARHTLVQQKHSFLASLLSGRHAVARDKNGRIFLDRDAELFRILLNFLRNPSTPPQPRDAAESDAISLEADFFGIRFFPFPLVFAVGGHSGTEHLNSLEVLDINQQCWRVCTKMATSRAYFGSSLLLNKMFVYGGQNLDYKALCDVEIFDCLRDCWTSGASLNVPRRSLCGICVENRHFAIGGFDGSNILSSVECYDPRMKNWMELAPLSTPRSSAMCCLHEDTLYVLGGTSGERLRTVERYEPRVNKWESLAAEMIEVRSAGAAVSSLQHAIVMGGIDNSNTILNSVELLDPQSNRWSFLANMDVPRMDCAAVVVSGSVLVSGGQNEEVLASTAFLRSELNEWHPGPPMLSPRYGHGILMANL